MALDIGPEIRAALEPLLDDQIDRVAHRVVELLDARAADVLLDLDGLAALLGCSRSAIKSRLARDKALRDLAVAGLSPRRWQRSAVLALIAARAGDAR